jgi:hypothetical protein
VTVRLGEDEIAELRAAAGPVGLTLSGYIAEAALATARDTAPPTYEIEREQRAAALDPQVRIPPTETEIEQLFAGWREELVTCAGSSSTRLPAGRCGTRIPPVTFPLV